MIRILFGALLFALAAFSAQASQVDRAAAHSFEQWKAIELVRADPAEKPLVKLAQRTTPCADSCNGMAFGGGNSGGGSSYTGGPGDILAAVYWWGLRCYSSTYAGNVAQLVDVATGTTTGSLLQCSGGTVTASSSASACTFVTGNACSPIATTCAVACSVNLLYEQVAGGPSMGLRTGFNVGKDTPVYTQNCIGSLPCMTFTASADGGNGQTLGTSIGTLAAAQPVGYSIVARRTANFTTGQILVSAFASTQTQITFTSSANTIQAYGGGAFTATAADSTFHAINVTYNGNSPNSEIRVNATNTTGSGGTGGFSATDMTIGQNVGGNALLTGQVTEFGIWSSSSFAVDAPALATNQCTYWGFASC